MVASSRMGLPSSVTAMVPAFCNARKSVRIAPWLERVAAAMANTLTTAPRSAWRSHSTHSTESTTGAVLGMVQTEVKPPAAAAAVPVAMVSLWSWPGSRRCTWRSMKPGATISPRASNFSSALPLILFAGAISATRPSLSSKSTGASMRAAGSMRWPRLISRLFRFLSGVVISFWSSSKSSNGARQNRHARGDAVMHFFQDAGLRSVGDFAGQFQASDNRTGVHDDGIFLRHLQTGRVHLIASDVSREVDLHTGQALGLDAQQQDHIGSAQGVFDVAGDA